jgi:hypothetical protein
MIGPAGQVLANQDFINAVNQNIMHAFGGAPAFSWDSVPGPSAPTAASPAAAPAPAADMTPAPANPPAGMTALLSTPYDKQLDDRESKPFRHPLSLAPTAFGGSTDTFADAGGSAPGTKQKSLGTFGFGSEQV